MKSKRKVFIVVLIFMICILISSSSFAEVKIHTENNKSLAGIFLKMRYYWKNSNRNSWINSEDTTYGSTQKVVNGWGNESVWKVYMTRNNLWINADEKNFAGDPSRGLISSVGALCFGHATKTNENSGVSSIRTINIDYESSKEELRLAYLAFKSVSGKEMSNVDASSEWKLRIRRWLYNNSGNYGINLQSKNEVSKDYKIEEVNSYANKIYNRKLNLRKYTDTTYTTITIDNKDYLRIGPIGLKADSNHPINKITVNVETELNGTVNRTVKYIKKDGGNRKAFDKVQTGGNWQKYYIFIQKGTITDINSITVYQDITYYKSKVVMSRPNVSDGQNICIFDAVEQTDTVTKSKPYNVTINDPKYKLDFIKQNELETELRNVGFIIKYQDGTYLAEESDGTISYKKLKKNATTFYTNKKGRVKIQGEELKEGTYSIYETVNPYDKYKYNPDAVVATVQAVDVEEDTDPIIITNQISYISISGYAWEDIINPNKESTRDAKYDSSEDTADKRIANVKVYLMEGNNVVKDETGNDRVTDTNNNGYYRFEKIPVDKINTYYVRFEYNGMAYEALPKGNNTSDYESKADEKGRLKFNKDFKSITYNKANGNSGDINLRYTKSDYNSTLKYGDSLKYGYNNARNPINGVYDEFIISAETPVLSNLKGDSAEYLNEGINNINLGVYEREQPDVALLKDLYNVRISVNGYNHIYEYGQRLNHLENNSNDEEAAFNAGVQFPSGKQNDYNNISYNRAIYTSDYDYNDNDNAGMDENLKVYATYKLVIKNESTNLKVRVNEIVDYYHEAFTIESIGTGIDEETGKITGNVNYTNDDTNKKLYINTNAKISGNSKNEIYVQFSITKDKIGEFLHEATGDNNQKYQSTNNLENIAEITSYSVFDKNENIYAGVDKDSNPGNADLSKVREGKREDDTSIAPGFMIEVRNSRKITGTVFLDNSVLAADKTRNGDGIYQEGTESTISGVKVGLYKVSDLTKKENIDQYGNNYTTYELNDNATPVGNTVYSNETATTTNNDGQFTVKNFYPGEYVIVYTWGEQTYIGGTTNSVNVNDYKGTIYNEGRTNGSTWYLTDEGVRYSDAMDNYETRKEIDKEDSTITTMDSITPIMEFGIETIIGDNETLDRLEKSSGIDKIEFIIPNVDFGIVERARQEIDIAKRVETVEITLANGQTIANYKYNEDQPESSKGVTYIPPSAGLSNGMVKAEIDNELIQGATVKIKYAISLENNSEVDYDDMEYYLYGIVPTQDIENKIIKYIPSDIYDYLDNTLTLSDNENANWNVVPSENHTTDVISLQNKTILYNVKNDDINEKIKNILPGAKPQTLATLTTSKVLANSEEINLNNDVEVTKVTPKNGQKTGRPVTKTLLYDRAESVVITPPTGITQEYIMITISAIMFLLTLGTGIVFIKKKILK